MSREIENRENHLSVKNDDYRPITVGLRAAKANFIPGLIIQGAMVAVVLAYYWYPPLREWLAHLAELKRDSGYLFSAVSGMVAGGILPELLSIAVFQHWQIRRENVSNLLFGICFWGFQGVLVDTIYRLQTWMFGSQVDFLTVAKKTLVDQFIFSPLIPGPISVIVFEWKHQGYSFAGLSRVFTLRFYQQKIIPTIVTAWGFWFPIVILVYCLPPLLQVPMFTLALTLWVMVFTWITHAHKDLAI